MKPRYVYTALICALLIFLAAIITLRAKTDPLNPVAPAIHTEAPETDDAETESIEVREAPDDVAADAEPEPEPTECDPDELDLLARLICGEMGASWAPDDQQLNVGSVVLNRVASDAFPDTLEEVIYQRGQYACAGYLNSLTPDERTIANARKLLEDGSILPANVVFQSECKQGTVYASYHDDVLGTTTYYCTTEG